MQATIASAQTAQATQEGGKLFSHYPFRVVFRKRHKRGIFAGQIGSVETLHYVSEASAREWVDGIDKNCREWQFYGEPKIEPNPDHAKRR